MNKKIDFRQRARGHYKAVSRLMKSGEDDLLIPAALRLRMAIECFAYEILQSFEDDVAQESMETWQPGRLIRELKEIDPSVDGDRSLSIAVGEKSEVAEKKMLSLGTDTRLSAAWIHKNWNALGSYLHEPTIKQHADGNLPDRSKVREKIVAIADEVERVLASKLFATSLNVSISQRCECGFSMKRREELLRRDGQVICADCGTIWGVEQVEDAWLFSKLFHRFECPNCKEENRFPAKELFEGSEFTCRACGSSLIVKKDWCIRFKGIAGD